MDLASIIGIVSALGLLAVAIFMKPGGDFFFKADAFIIVFGGTIASTMIQFPMKSFLGLMKIVKKAMFHKEIEVDVLINQLVDLSKRARVEGLLSLEKDIASIEDEFIKKGLQLMVDGTESDVLRDLMAIELTCLEDRHKVGQDIFTAMAEYSPAFGMAGTLIGLIQMLQALSDPSKIGAGMAVALVTTFYGVVFANVFYIPFAGKLKVRSKNEVLIRELAIEGICAIQAGDNPRLLRDKLMTFLAPSQRSEAEGES